MIAESGQTIEDYRWKNRIVITNSDSIQLDSALIAQKEEIAERKLLFVEFHDGVFIKSSNSEKIDADSFLKAITQRNPKAEWALVGLDGGVKASGLSQEFTLKKIFMLIDQMPMRKSEINGKQ